MAADPHSASEAASDAASDASGPARPESEVVEEITAADPTRLFSVAGKLALVTGSSRGLGRSLALTLARAGAQVVLHGRDAAALEEVRSTIVTDGGVEPLVVSFDVTDAEASRTALEALVAEHGAPDILVNNAGLQRRAPIQEFSSADWDAVVASNLDSVFHVSRPLLPAMISRGSGRIVNIASVQSQLARGTIAPYSATKGAVVQLTKGMAADLTARGIQVNALSPGYFATEMNRALVDDEQFTSWLTARTPAGRWGSFAELDGALLFLCSPASSFVAGQNLVVDGGMTAVV